MVGWTSCSIHLHFLDKFCWEVCRDGSRWPCRQVTQNIQFQSNLHEKSSFFAMHCVDSRTTSWGDVSYLWICLWWKTKILSSALKLSFVRNIQGRRSGIYTHSFSLEVEWMKMCHWVSGFWQANSHHFILWIGFKMATQLSQEWHIPIPSGRKPPLVILHDRTPRSLYLQKYPCTLMHAHVLRIGLTQISWRQPQQNLEPMSLIHLEMESHYHIHLFLNQPSPTMCCSLTFCGLLLPSSLPPQIRTPSTD